MRGLRYLSVCSGIEAASVAWEPLGWSPVAFSEIEKFPSAVLAHRYGANMPGEAHATNGVPNWGDMTNWRDWPDADIDVLVGGTPCQSFSVAGLRKGLDDPRGNLALTYLAIADRYRPEWLVWENVPGVLSSNGGRDFGAFLGGLEKLGVGWAYRVLDAQYIRVDGFGRAVPQRRRRVIVVGHLGDWRRAAAVLIEPESLSGDPAPRRKAGQGTAADVAPGLVASGRGVERIGETRGQDPVIAAPLCAGNHHGDQDGRETHLVAHALRGEGFDASEDGTGRGVPIVPVDLTNGTAGGDVSGTIEAGQDRGNRGQGVLAFGGGNTSGPVDVATALTAHGTRQDFEVETFVAFHGAQDPDVTDGPAHPVGRNHGVETCVAIQERAVSENPDAGPDGTGVRDDGAAYTLEARTVPQAVAFAENSHAEVRFEGGDGSVSGALSTGGGKPGQGVPAVVQSVALRGRDGGAAIEAGGDVAHALRASTGGGDKPHMTDGMIVRRLMPVECERLQGFPDGYTAVPWRGKAAGAGPDGPRYKALGNSMAVNVMRWIGRRIDMVREIAEEIDAGTIPDQHGGTSRRSASGTRGGGHDVA